LQHILWAEWRWLGQWLTRPLAGCDPLECPDLVALRERWSEIEGEQLEFLQRDLGRSISYDNPPGTRWTYQLRHMLRHLVNHSTYHRGQVAAMLRLESS